MPRITVVSETVDAAGSERPTTLSERINSVHLADEHSSYQFLERLAWAITDAENAEARFRAALGP
jgi:hypothetical protein